MVVYLDIVFFENVFMNFLIIYSANAFVYKKTNIYRMILASIIGAVFYVMVLLPISDFFSYTMCKIGLVLLLVIISFKYIDILTLFQNIFIFLVSSSIYGGLMYAAYYFIFNKMDFEYYPIKLLLLISLITFILCINGVRYIKTVIDYKKIIYDIDIILNGRVKRIKGFLDTGNCLTTLISKKPVLIINYNCIKDLLPESIKKIYADGKININDSSFNLERGVSILPYTSIGNINGIMLGYKMDKAVIYFTKDENIVLENILIGINTTNINGTKDFDALLSLELLEMQRRECIC